MIVDERHALAMGLAGGAALMAWVASAAQPFPDGYTLNDGRAIAFPQALPRTYNAATFRTSAPRSSPTDAR